MQDICAAPGLQQRLRASNHLRALIEVFEYNLFEGDALCTAHDALCTAHLISEV